MLQNRLSLCSMYRDNFGRMRKFAEGCRQALRPKAKRHLTFLLSAVPLHGKIDPDQEEQNEQSTMAKEKSLMTDLVLFKLFI